MIDFLPEIFCQDNVHDFIRFNASEVEIGTITHKMCNLSDSKQLFPMTKLVLEKLDLENLIQLVMKAYMRVLLNNNSKMFIPTHRLVKCDVAAHEGEKLFFNFIFWGKIQMQYQNT